ncbi:MAG: Tetratricopeptide repeat protein, partial [Anaerolineales bacterium]|nr:Tetratricopeptide repeat protein [Anaerolineales bacterium]
MATLDQALASLQQAVGADMSSAIVRRLLHVPGALDWLREEPVRDALARSIGNDPSLPAAALLAATGHASLSSLPESWPPSMAARREGLMAGEAVGEVLSADDVLILAGEILRSDRNGGAREVRKLLSGTLIDWRAPLAVAWQAIADQPSLAAHLASSTSPRDLAALVSALRANRPDDESAQGLAAAAGDRVDVVLLRLVETGDVAFAARVSSAAAHAVDGSPDAGFAGDAALPALRQRLQVAWETRRGELAALTDGLAIVAAADGDTVTALEARQQALQIGPSDSRLANVAIALTQKGDAAGALSLVSPSPTTPDLGFAAGWAYLKGGAVEKGRGMLIESALNALEIGEPKATTTMASGLVACGEPGLALDIYRAVLAEAPADVLTRCAYAQSLADTGDFQAALEQARLVLALDGASSPAMSVEAESLRQLGRPAEALAVLKAAPPDSNPARWEKSVECAIALADHEQAQALLADPPASVPVTDRTLLTAKALAAQGRRTEAVAMLEAATVDHPAEVALWLGVARLHQEAGNPGASAETLRRATQMAPGSASIHAALAHTLRMQGMPSEALAAAQEALRVDPRGPQANLEAGRAWLALGRPNEAVDPLRTAHRRIPADQETRLALATAFEATGQTESARTLFTHLAEAAPAEAWLISGRLDLAGESAVEPARAKSAAAKLLRARTLGAHDAALPYWLARAFEDAGEPGRAAQAYAEYLQASPRDPQMARFAALHKAQSLLLAGDSMAAIREFEALRASEGQDPKVLGPLALAYLSVSLIDEARLSAQTLLGIDPTERDGLQVMSSVAQQTGGWNEAAEAFHTAAKIVGTDAELWMTAAEASLHAGDLAQAAGALERVLNDSDDLIVRRRAAHVLVGLDQGRRAAGLLKSIASAQPDDPTVWTELADVAESAGDAEASIEALNRVAELTPGDPEIQARRAAALWSAGRRSESIGAWQKGLDLTPDDLPMQRALARAMVANGEVQIGLNLFAKSLERHPTDADLLTESGLATLRHSSPQEAVDLLTRAADVSPSVETLGALGEAWLRLSQPERAFDVLAAATSLPGTTAAAWALYAEAAVSIGDLAAAEAAIVEARRPDAATPADRLALSRAELRLGNWGDALTALAPILSTGEPQYEIALAETILRVLEARWLFGEAALARRHAPGEDVPSESLFTWLATSLAGPMGLTEEGRVIGARLRLTRSIEDEEALADLQTRPTEDPAKNEPYEALAVALLRRQRPSEALEVLRKAQPDQLGANWQALLAGVAHLHGGSPSLARQAFVDASEDAGLRPVAQFLLARAHLAQGYTDSAIAALNAALAQWTDEAAWHAALADLYLTQSDVDAALPHLQSAVELDPENAPWRLAYGRALRDAGHLSDALQAYQRLLPLLPSDAQVWHEAGELAVVVGEFTQAENLFDHAASLAPTEAAHLVGKARAALGAGKLRDARRHAESAVRLGGDQPDALQCLAVVAARHGESDRAVELLDRAAAVAKDAPALRRTRTRLLIDIGRAEQAAQELREHLAAAPDDDEAWSSLGEALEAADEYSAASQALEAAMRLRPRSAELHVRMARVERKSGQLDHALDLLRQAEGLDPLQPELALELGQVYEARRELDRALDAYCRSTEAFPHAAEAFRRAGHVFKSLKAYSEAESMLARAAELDPTDTATLQQLAAVRALE